MSILLAIRFFIATPHFALLLFGTIAICVRMLLNKSLAPIFVFFLLLFLTISLALSVFLLNFKLDFYALELFIADVDATVVVFVIVIGSHYNFAHFIYTYCTHTHTLFSGKFGVTLRVWVTQTFTGATEKIETGFARVNQKRKYRWKKNLLKLESKWTE